MSDIIERLRDFVAAESKRWVNCGTGELERIEVSPAGKLVQEAIEAMMNEATEPSSPENELEMATRLDEHAIRYANDYGYNVATDLKRAAEMLRRPAQCAQPPLPGELEADAWVASLCWQPMETAPKDGTWILTFRPNATKTSIHQARWQKRIFDDYEWGGMGWSFPENSQPTHWQPMPGPPSTVTSTVPTPIENKEGGAA